MGGPLPSARVKDRPVDMLRGLLSADPDWAYAAAIALVCLFLLWQLNKKNDD